ncbi:haloacid dehalogenase-like hydrolase [Litoribacter alkaliphilus]|uniref:Haloacid dehalogenase-like hydrolase n=1 Tax=Litoribacter ruber TaxID=702568 RepID=A0AAP2G243_9BACT|nr:haloacid dehalogenase-like hydrolase [Litoribacter alkaliphilus]MBS9525604.1 haloacid dehalogenase-like hydrolase [Litoribacter alkaliphilus]
MEKDKEEMYIFDVCGTLYHSNTTYDFLKYFFLRNNYVNYMKISLLLSIPVKVFIVALNKIGWNLPLRSYLVGLLEGTGLNEVEVEAEKFVKEILCHRKIDAVHGMLQGSLSEGKKVLLVSASIDPVIKAIAKDLGVGFFVCSTLEVMEKNFFTGKFSKDIKGNKANIANEGVGIEWGKTSVFTDNKDDMDLIERCDSAFVISKKRNINFWEKKLKSYPNSKLIHV